MRAADDDTPSLPEDPAALRALLLETLAQVDTLTAERDALASQNERLQHLLLKLKRRQFGTKSEKLPEDQLLFAFEEIEATLAANAAEAGKQSPALRDNRAKRRRAGRGRLPAHLPRIEVVLAPEATACPCCQGPLVEIGVDAAERLDVIPAQFRVVVTKRPKLACRACPGVVLQEPAPARLIEGGMPTEATVAHVLVSRYADHLPLYRQSQMLARQGIEIGREVLADWAGTGAMEFVPVVRRMREILLASSRLFADETTMPVLDPGRGRTKKGYAWAITRDDRPWGVGLTRRRWCSTTRQAAAPSMRRRCWPAIAASCNATATPPTRRWPRQMAALRWRSAGAMCGGNSSTWRRARPRRSPRRRCGASPPSMPLRPTCAASRPTSAMLAGRSGAVPW
jgi:transposase